MTAIRRICSAISERFPEKCAEDWDNPGLLLGRRDAEASRVLAALELTPDIVQEAKDLGVQLIVTHHPFIFKPIKSLTDDSPDGRMMLDLLENHIALLAAHTNLDSAPHAIADKLASLLGLSDTRPLISHEPYAAYKIVVFAPAEAADTVAQAMHAFGAGCVGHYSDVSFRVQGEGMFTGDETTHPAYGVPNKPETVKEMRIEMVVSGRNLHGVIRAMREAHPYEEPAFDVFKIESEVAGLTDLYGFGTIGHLPSPMILHDFVSLLKKAWEIPSLRMADIEDRPVQRIAILNGSGARYLKNAANAHADVYITGDCGHHDFDMARRMNIGLIDAGHYDTEKFIPEILAQTLKDSKIGNEIDVIISKQIKNPYILR